MAELETPSETTEEATEESEETTEESSDVAAKLLDAQSTNASLRAMLAHVAPDIDVEAELDNIATKRDGTLVYIGESAAPAPEEKPKAKAAPRNRPAQTRGGPGKASVSAMDDKGLQAAVAKNGMRQFAG